MSTTPGNTKSKSKTFQKGEKETPEWVRIYEALKQAKEAMEYSLRGLDPHDLNTKGMIREALETINKLGL